MTLEEAIKHCDEVSNTLCNSCGAEHRQLAAWLRELKDLKADCKAAVKESEPSHFQAKEEGKDNYGKQDSDF